MHPSWYGVSFHESSIWKYIYANVCKKRTLVAPSYNLFIMIDLIHLCVYDVWWCIIFYIEYSAVHSAVQYDYLVIYWYYRRSVCVRWDLMKNLLHFVQIIMVRWKKNHTSDAYIYTYISLWNVYQTTLNVSVYNKIFHYCQIDIDIDS